MFIHRAGLSPPMCHALAAVLTDNASAIIYNSTLYRYPSLPYRVGIGLSELAFRVGPIGQGLYYILSLPRGAGLPCPGLFT